MEWMTWVSAAPVLDELGVVNDSGEDPEKQGIRLCIRPNMRTSVAFLLEFGHCALGYILASGVVGWRRSREVRWGELYVRAIGKWTN